MIGRNGEKRSGISAQAARHDDDDIFFKEVFARLYSLRQHVFCMNLYMSIQVQQVYLHITPSLVATPI